MSDPQLSLLDWTPPTKVIAFPLVHRHGKIRHVADVLERKHGSAATGYWKQTVAALMGQFERAGIPDDVARHQVRAFHDAVQVELQRRACRGQRPGGDAA